MAGLVIGLAAVIIHGVIDIRSNRHNRTEQDYLTSTYGACTCRSSGSCATCAYWSLSPRERKRERRARKHARKACRWSHGKYPCASCSESKQLQTPAHLPVTFMQQSGASQYPAPQNIVRTVERRASSEELGAPPKYDEGSWNKRRRSVEVLVPAAGKENLSKA